MIYIGIDAGATTGVGVWDSKLKILHLISGSFWEMIHTIAATYIISGATFIIEDPNLNKPVFVKSGTKGISTILKVAQNVGANKRDAQLWIEWCEFNSYPYKTVRPTKKKLNRKEFDQLTNYNLPSNQHERDAGRLVYGR